MTITERLVDLLTLTATSKGSDLHLTCGAPPLIRIQGELRAVTDGPALTPDITKQLAYSCLTDSQRARCEAGEEVDLSFGISGLARFRCNVFRQRGTVAAVYRLIPEHIPSLDELGLPSVVRKLTTLANGLVLIAGPAGSGKSTTLAAMVDRINVERKGHILTIEDPIEFVHRHKNSIVNQREIHTDASSFGAALRAVLREDPDVVLIGEMRDVETIESALRIAETGHLTLATLHTGSAFQTINRIIDMFPARQQNQARSQLSTVLEGVVCQTLVPMADGGGRVVATEVMVATPAIRNLIREGKSQQIYSVIQVGQNKMGMRTMNQSLAALVREQRVTTQQALAHSSDRDELQQILQRSSGPTIERPRQVVSSRAGERRFGAAS